MKFPVKWIDRLNIWIGGTLSILFFFAAFGALFVGRGVEAFVKILFASILFGGLAIYSYSCIKSKSDSGDR